MSVLASFSLDGRVALVTGGGSGLGAAMAVALAEAGATVVVAGRTAARLEDTCERIANAGGSASATVLDVTDPASVEEALGAAAAQHGGLDVLVSNAGIEHEALAIDADPGDWRRVIDVNLNGTFYCARAFARLAPDAERPRAIVNVASIGAAVGVRAQTAYCASKGGVTSLTQALALELAPRRIRVNAIAPGYFRTEMPAALLADPERARGLLRRVPAGRIPDPEEIGPPVVFLASDAAAYMTGATLYFDGGYTAQ